MPSNGRIARPVMLAGWYAYSVGIDDGLQYAPLSQLERDVREKNLEYSPTKQQLELLPNVLKLAGWEGDGTIKYFVLPPYFAADEAGATFWFPAFFVKQENNGSGFVAALRPLGISVEMTI